jgi:hypothetical protein
MFVSGIQDVAFKVLNRQFKRSMKETLGAANNIISIKLVFLKVTGKNYLFLMSVC